MISKGKNKEKLIQDLRRDVGMTYLKADEALDVIFGEIKKSLGKGEPVTIRKLGFFHTRKKSARVGRNPKTGEPAPIKERTVAFFRAGYYLKRKVGKLDV